MPVVCPACDHSNLAASRFCNACGQHLTTPFDASQPVGAPSVAAAQRATPRLPAELAGRDELALNVSR